MEDVTILGNPITTLKDMKLSTDEYCENITVR